MLINIERCYLTIRATTDFILNHLHSYWLRNIMNLKRINNNEYNEERIKSQ